MANIVYVILCLCFEALRQVQCQANANQPQHPPAYIANSYNKPMQLQPAQSENHYNFFDNMVLGLGWIIPIITVVLLGICLLGICGLMERNLTKKPEARLYYQSPGGAAAQGKSASYGSPDDSIAKQKYALAEQEQEVSYGQGYGYNDPAPEYAEGGYGYGAAAGADADTSGQHLYRPDQV